MNFPNTIELNLKGKSCPIPVIETRKAILGLTDPEAEAIISVLLDNSAALANVSRFAESQGFTASCENLPDGSFALTLARGFSCELPTIAQAEPKNSYQIYIDNCCMGQGEEKLGRLLMKAFLKTLPELDRLPESLIFVNRGVYLTVADSAELKTIQDLAAAGCKVLVCGTCLDFYNLKDKLAVGQVSNMFEIAGLLSGSERVVKL
ncbi:MAG TPA: sulfurtransferase-like selenium metabolism protein YedF [Proteobacteria bacterium]|nr:sulfurtransferase-like selenium metabolism protein YedF [Pseudomonadota bacterium]